MLSPTSYALPQGHSYIIGITPSAASDATDVHFRLHTIAETWGATSLESAAWRKVDQPIQTGFRLTSQSLVVEHPDGRHALFTGPGSTIPTLFDY
ncbi:MAG: hypothetical protein V4773_18405 [Verrucomicrobiota bacterium]